MILCCGEALIDMIPAVLPSGNSGFAPKSGGAVFNTSISLGRLGAEVGMLTALSSDMFGEQLLADLRASQVQTDLIIRSTHSSTLAFVKLTHGHAEYAFFDALSAESQLRVSDVRHLPESVSALYFGGISLAREPGGAFYQRIAEQNKTLPMMIDPNIRPGFIGDEAAYRARLDVMLRAADIVKVSDEDLAWIFPYEGNDAARIAAIRALGDKIVIMTKGSDGALAYLPDGSQVHAPARKSEVVDTVGAGDTFNAGVLAFLQKRCALSKLALRSIGAEDMRGALDYGAAVAAITVSRAGADAPWADEVQ